MSAIFISHSSHDNHVADEIRTWLAEQGHRSVFLDFDPAHGIPAGRDWEQELYRNIRACRAVIVLCSEHSMTSRWCFMEITHARALGKPLFPVKIDDCDVDGVLTDRQVVVFNGNREEALARLWNGILAAGIDPADAFDWDGSRSPYPGLLAFQEEDASIFFGRDDEIGEGLDLVNKVRRLGQTGLVMVLGASGSGKSSLVRAGLVPRLRRDTERWLVVDPFRPRDDPARGLAVVLSRAFERVGRTLPWQRIYEWLGEAMERVLPGDEEAAPPPEAAEAEQAEKARFLEQIEQLKQSLPKGAGAQAARYLRLLHAAVNEDDARFPANGAHSGHEGGHDLLGALAEDLRLRSNRPEARVLLLIDQFEELLGHGPEHPNTRFLQLLRHSLDRPSGPILALGTMRSDFLSQFQNSPALLDVRYESLSVGPMSPEDVAQVIEKPAQLAAIDLEPGLVQALVADAETEDALPLLAFTLRELNERYGDDGLLEIHEYRERLGGLQGAVAKAADEILAAERVDAAQEALLRKAFLSMVRIMEDGTPARRPAHWDELPAEIHPLLEKFVQGRLLVAGADADGRTLEVAHEALFRSWDRLVLWLDENAEALRLRREIRMASGSWEAGERALEDLWRGGRLARARELIESGDLPLEPLGYEFVEASYWAEQAHIQAEEARRKKALRRTRIFAAVVGVAFLLALAGGLYALEQKQEADGQRREAQAAQAQAETQKQAADLAKASAEISAAEAVASALQADSARADALRQKAVAETQRTVAQENERVADQAKLAADSSAREAAQSAIDALAAKQKADAERRRTLGIGLSSKAKRQAEDGAPELGALLAREAYVFDDSSGGEFINEVYDALRKTLSALGHETATTRKLVSRNSDWVRSVAYSEGGWVAAAGNDGQVYLWPSSTSADSARVLASATGKKSQRPPGASAIHRLVFSPTGNTLATLGDDRTLRLWPDLGKLWSNADLAEPTTLDTHDGPAWDVVFSPDGNRLASASAGNTIRVWNVQTGAAEIVLPTEGFEVRALAFHPTDGRLAAGCTDGTIRIWTMQNSAPLVFDAHRKSVNAVAFSHDGTRLASGGSDHVVKVWTVEDPRAEPQLLHDDSGLLRGHKGPVNVVAFSPDNTKLASGSSDHTVRLWELGKPGVGPIVLEGHTSWVQSLTFGDDGNTLISGSADRTVRTWMIDARIMADAICDAVARPDAAMRTLSKNDWATFIGADIPYDSYVPCPESR